MNKTQTFQLLSQWHGGDKQGLDELIERHLPWLQQQVRRHMTPLLRGKAETVDYVQDAVIQFLQYAPRFELSEEKLFRALLLKVVKSALLNKYDWYTAKRRDIARDRPLPSDTILSLDPPRNEVRTPSMSADRHEREAWIRLGMEFLDIDDREVIVLHQWQGKSFVDIGKKLELSADAVRMRHNRAVNRLTMKVWELRQGNLENLLEEESGA
jgi:RNA polymerase sigma factor (sigma-70 family)